MYFANGKNRSGFLDHFLIRATCVSLLIVIFAPPLDRIGDRKILAAEPYTPESYKVRRMVQRGALFLRLRHSTIGGHCLVALALYKAGERKTNSMIQSALERCRAECQPDQLADNSVQTIYSHAIALIFLCEVSPIEYRKETQALVKFVVERQKLNGSWDYLRDQNNSSIGDTSQTQYSLLALWEARRAGLTVPDEPIVRACNWLIRTQDETGGWAYRSHDPGIDNGNRIGQPALRLSCAVAAMGSLYVCADIFAIKNEKHVDLPPLMRVVRKVKEARGIGINRKFFQRALTDGNRWIERNYTIHPRIEFPHYYRYALERYHSFRENYLGRDEIAPSWYQEGVEVLARLQEADGHFGGGESRHREAGSLVATAFSLLFLTRSTKQSLRPLHEGQLMGGRGLPSDDSIIFMRGGRLAGASSAAEIGQILDIVKKTRKSDTPADIVRASFNEKSSFEDDRRLNDQLRSLLSHKSRRVRQLMVETVARTRRVEVVPTLINALSDSDVRVVRAARDGLRFVSRKLDGFGLPDDPTSEEIEQAQGKWRDWLAVIRPDVESDNFPTEEAEVSE